MLFLALAAAQVPLMPRDGFIPVASPVQIAAAYQMCRAVVTPEGFDRKVMLDHGWSGVRVQDSNAMYLSKEANVWGPPDSYILVSLRQKGRTFSCSIAARVQDQTAVDQIITNWPERLNDSSKKQQFTTSVDGQNVTLNYSGRKFPNINIEVSREMDQQ